MVTNDRITSSSRRQQRVRIDGGVTPLMLGATGDPDILRMLIDAGADVNARDRRGITALMRAARHPENVSVLKAAGAEE